MRATRLFAKWLQKLLGKVVPKYIPAETLLESWERRDRRAYWGSMTSCAGFGIFLILLVTISVRTLF